jgi:hypothetical protein
MCAVRFGRVALAVCLGSFPYGAGAADNEFGSSVSFSADGGTLAVGAIGEDRFAPQSSGAVYVFTRTGSAWTRQARLKASNPARSGAFGVSVSLSADGGTLAVGADNEDVSSTGVGGEQAGGVAESSGAVYVFTGSASAWSQQAYLKASNTGAGDSFGQSVSLSSDGNTLAVGASSEDGGAKGIGSDDDSSDGSGAVYVFVRSAGVWSQQAYLKASNAGAGDGFGQRVSLSSEGATLAVGAPGEASGARGVGGDASDDSAIMSGAAYVFTRTAGGWSQQAYLKASNARASDLFGVGLSLSSDGSTLVTGASHESSAATGIGGDQMDESALSSGAAYVFTRRGGEWRQQAYVKASNTGAVDWFGDTLSLSSDGSTLAVASYFEGSSATGIGGDQTDDSARASGAVYVFGRSGDAWRQHAYVKASNAGTEDAFGIAVSLSADGSRLAVGASLEDGSATGIGMDRDDDAAAQSGAVYIFTRSSSGWSQEAYLKAERP